MKYCILAEYWIFRGVDYPQIFSGLVQIWSLQSSVLGTECHIHVESEMTELCVLIFQELMEMLR